MAAKVGKPGIKFGIFSLTSPIVGYVKHFPLPQKKSIQTESFSSRYVKDEHQQEFMWGEMALVSSEQINTSSLRC